MLDSQSWVTYYAVAGFFGVLTVFAGILSAGHGYELVMAARKRKADRTTLWFTLKLMFTLSIGYLLLGAATHGIQQGAVVDFLDSQEASQRGYVAREELLGKLEAINGRNCDHVEIVGSQAVVLSVRDKNSSKAICGTRYDVVDRQALFPFIVLGKDIHTLIGEWPFQSHLIIHH